MNTTLGIIAYLLAGVLSVLVAQRDRDKAFASLNREGWLLSTLAWPLVRLARLVVFIAEGDYGPRAIDRFLYAYYDRHRYKGGTR